MSNHPVHFEIHASDPDKSIAFYQALLGWRFERYPVPGVYYGVITGDEKTLGINGGLIQRMGRPPAEGAPMNAWPGTVDVANIDTAFAKALELGRREPLPKMAIPQAGYVAYIKDIDCNIVGLQRADPGAR